MNDIQQDERKGCKILKKKRLHINFNFTGFLLFAFAPKVQVSIAQYLFFFLLHQQFFFYFLFLHSCKSFFKKKNSAAVNEEKEEALHCVYIILEEMEGKFFFVDDDEEEEGKIGKKEIALMENAWAKKILLTFTVPLYLSFFFWR